MAARASTGTLNALVKAISIEDHDEILKTTTAALESIPQDHAIRHTKVVALLKLDRFEDAIRVIDEGGAEVHRQCPLESAYAHYKSGNLSKAREYLQPALSSGQRSVLHLEAQVAYRAEKFTEASKAYELLSADSSDHEEGHDLNINELAVLAQLRQRAGRTSQRSRDDLGRPDTFEVAYNAACVHISNGFYDEALRSISLAKQLCDSSEELSDQEKEEEMVPILVQLGYIYFRKGLLKEAADVYRSINPSLCVPVPILPESFHER